MTLGDGAVVSAREALACACNLRLPSAEVYALLAAEAEKDDGANTFGLHDVLDLLLEFPSARPRIGALAGQWRFPVRLWRCGAHGRNVDLALQQIGVTQGGMDAAAAKHFRADLMRAGRYRRDVY